MSIRNVSANGIHYECRGRGEALLFIHGWCLDRRLWIYAEEAFAETRQVVTPDLAGFGRSSGLAGPYSLDRHADDICALIAELRLDRVVIVGFAYGAAVAMHAARRENSMIQAVVAVGAPSAEASPYDRMPRSMRRDWPDFARRSAQALFHETPSQATLDWIAAIFVSAPLPVAIETVGELARFEPTNMAGEVPVPLLFVQGENDKVSPPETGKACCDAASKGKLETIAGSGHLIVIEAKEAFHERLRDFLETLPRE